MSVNTTEIKLMRFSMSSQFAEEAYMFSGEALESAELFRYLRFHFFPNLSWQNHVDFYVSMAWSSLDFFHCSLRQAYKSFTYSTVHCPKLEYTSFIWNPHQMCLINKLEFLQNKAVHCYQLLLPRQCITTNYSQ